MVFTGLRVPPPKVPPAVLAKGTRTTTRPPVGNSILGNGEASATEYVRTFSLLLVCACSGFVQPKNATADELKLPSFEGSSGESPRMLPKLLAVLAVGAPSVLPLSPINTLRAPPNSVFHIACPTVERLKDDKLLGNANVGASQPPGKLES
ncbi:MAG: hypothetical protein BWZ07_01390 [Alphaproteobacteria bacterium ADurb.BinA280]|nr:MAG: hypothetical protein BWZ07_01390 [Alphaproteobacteria bacterium ADurb.BinA280]